MKKFLNEFREFAMRGNVLDMAIGVIIGSAFGKITTSLVNDVIMPLISRITGGVDFSAWKWVLKAAEVDETGAETAAEIAVNYGSFIAVVLDFLIIALVLFMVVKAINDGISLPIEKAVEVEEKLFGDCFETHDQKEGMACFLSREKPKPKAVFTNN